MFEGIFALLLGRPLAQMLNIIPDTDLEAISALFAARAEDLAFTQVSYFR
jgi:hypothetical protein